MIFKFISMLPSNSLRTCIILILSIFMNGCSTNYKSSEKEVLTTEEELIVLTEEQFQSFNMELDSVLLQYNQTLFLRSFFRK